MRKIQVAWWKVKTGNFDDYYDEWWSDFSPATPVETFAKKQQHCRRRRALWLFPRVVKRRYPVSAAGWEICWLSITSREWEDSITATLLFLLAYCWFLFLRVASIFLISLLARRGKVFFFFQNAMTSALPQLSIRKRDTVLVDAASLLYVIRRWLEKITGLTCRAAFYSNQHLAHLRAAKPVFFCVYKREENISDRQPITAGDPHPKIVKLIVSH